MYGMTLAVDKLGLPLRAVNALKKHGIYTLDELVIMSDEQLMSLDGLGVTCVKTIRDVINKWLNLSEDELKETMINYELQNIGGVGVLAGATQVSVGEFLQNLKRSDRNVQMLIEYFTAEPRLRLDDLGERYGITRERVRQIIMNGVNNVRNAILRGEIDNTCIEEIKKAAEETTEISLVNVSDDVLGRAGLVRLMAAVFEKELVVIKSKKLYGEWLGLRENNINDIVDQLSNMLYRRDTPMKIEDVLTIFPISENMLFSIVDVIEKDGYVTLSTNKVATGTGRNEKIGAYLRKIGRPASVLEVANNTDLSVNQVRGAFGNSSVFVNVGRNIYDYVDADYSGLTISKLARNILLAENRALKLPIVIKYIQRYLKVDDWEIQKELFYGVAPIVYRKDEFVLLNEWGLDKIEVQVRHQYDISLEDAILMVVPETEGVFTAGEIAVKLRDKFGGSVSNNMNSIKQTLNSLAQNERIAKVGENTGCYRKARV